MKKKLNLTNYQITKILEGDYGSNGQYALCLMSISTKLRASFINATDSWNLVFSFENIIKELKISWGFSVKALIYTIVGLPIISILWFIQFMISMKNLISNEIKIKNHKYWTGDLEIERSYYGLRIYRKLSKKDINLKLILQKQKTSI